MRRLISEDADDLTKIRKTSFQDFWSKQEFETILSDKSFFGFRDDHGFILCRKALDSIDIVTFCVDPIYRRCGIGRRLLAEVVNFAEENNCEVFLEVAEKNLSARNLYKAFGFQEISIRKNYYKFENGVQDAIVMKL